MIRPGVRAARGRTCKRTPVCTKDSLLTLHIVTGNDPKVKPSKLSPGGSNEVTSLVEAQYLDENEKKARARGLEREKNG